MKRLQQKKNDNGFMYFIQNNRNDSIRERTLKQPCHKVGVYEINFFFLFYIFSC